MRSVPVLALSILVSLAAVTAFGQAAVLHDSQTVPIEFAATSCSGAPVLITGESTVTIHAVGNDNRGLVRTHIQFHLMGEGPNGERYVVNEQLNAHENNGPDSANVFHNLARLHVVETGSGDDLFVTTFIHTTVNANGEITSVAFEFETDCRG